ncbi:MAG: FtsX-like permease family protein [Pirellula sp.]
MFQVIWQHWLQRPSRFALTMASLVLSTATLIGILVASHNARSSFKELGKAVQGLPSLDVINSEGGRFDHSLLPRLPLGDDSDAIAPMLVRGSMLRFKEHKSRGLVIGIPLSNRGESTDQSVTKAPSESDARTLSFLKKTLELQDLQWPQQDECILSELVASQLRVTEGDSIQCLFRRGFRKLVVKKIIAAHVWNRIVSEHGVIVDLEWLQKVSALSGQVDRNRIFLASDNAADKKRVAGLVDAMLPKPLKVQERTNNVGVADDLLKSTELGLSFASALAVAMAAYILLNSTRMNLVERRPHFAILSCLGATSKQLSQAVLLEALILGIVGVLLGTVAGCGLGAVMGRVLSAVLQTPPGSFSIPWMIVLSVMILLPSLSVVVVWYAQKQQQAVSPLESFREPTIPDTHGLPWRSIRNGVLLWCIAMFGMYCVQQEWIAAQWGVVAGLMTLLAYLLWIPLGLVPLNWCIDRLTALRRGFPIEVAKNQLTRRPERTTLNAGFLVIALCGAVGLGQVLMSNTAEILRWYHRALPGDIFLISTVPPTLLIDSEDPLRERLEQIPGLEWSNAIRLIRCNVDEQAVLGIIREFPINAPFPTEPKGMDNTTARQVIDEDKIFIASILGKKLRKRAGDTVAISFNGRSFPMTIGGVNANFANGGMSFMMKRSTAQRFMEVTGFDWYALSITPDRLDQARDSLEAVKQQFGYELQLGSEMRKGVEQAISGVTAGVWSVVFISFLTGGFGIATTLAMNMIEQARDLSLLRIVGASRSQLMMTVLVQAWLLGVIGLVFGMAGGVTTVAIIWACSEALLGYTPEFEWNPMLMLGAGLGTLAIVTIAAWIPAWNAAKINPIEHLSYE